MSVLVINGSPNKDGRCAQCAVRLAKGFESKGHAVETVCLYDVKMGICNSCGTGWGNCAQGSCVLEDDFAALYESMSKAEAVCFVTPVYWHDLSEAMKMLVDRIRRCDLRAGGNHLLKGKPAIAVSVAKGTGHSGVRCLEALSYALNQLEMDVRDRILVTALSMPYMEDACEAAARTLGESILPASLQ